MRVTKESIQRVVGKWAHPDDVVKIAGEIVALFPATPDMLEDAIGMSEFGRPGDCMENALTVYQAACAEIDRYEAVKDRARQVATDIISETGQLRWMTCAGTANVSKPGVTVTYDPKGLDALVQRNRVVAEAIAPFRREKPRDGSLVIRPPSTVNLPSLQNQTEQPDDE